MGTNDKESPADNPSKVNQLEVDDEVLLIELKRRKNDGETRVALMEINDGGKKLPSKSGQNSLKSVEAGTGIQSCQAL